MKLFCFFFLFQCKTFIYLTPAYSKYCILRRYYENCKENNIPAPKIVEKSLFSSLNLFFIINFFSFTEMVIQKK